MARPKLIDLSQKEHAEETVPGDRTPSHSSTAKDASGTARPNPLLKFSKQGFAMLVISIGAVFFTLVSRAQVPDPALSPVYTTEFERLECQMSGIWLSGNVHIVIHGDGRVKSSATLRGKKGVPVTRTFQLKPGQLKSLNRLLENTGWLKRTEGNSRPPHSDLNYYAMTIVRHQQTHHVMYHDKSPEPFGALVSLMRGICRQELLYDALQSDDKQQRLHASREVFNELIARMGLKSYAPSLALKEVDFTRFEDVFIPWLKYPKDDQQEALATAIAWVGYLQRVDCYDDVLKLTHVRSRSDWDVVCQTLIRLGGPRAVSALKDLARAPSGRLDHAVSALIRLGQPGIKEILAILEQGVLPAERPQTRHRDVNHNYSDWYLAETSVRDNVDQCHDRWYLAERVVRACMAQWDFLEFTVESKKRIAVAVETLLASRVSGKWDAMRTEYFESYLAMAEKLPDRQGRPHLDISD